METTPPLELWSRFAAFLALEIALIVLVAFAVQTLTRSPLWQRTIWQVCAAGVLALLVVESSGLGSMIVDWIAPASTEPQSVPFATERGAVSVTTAELSSSPITRETSAQSPTTPPSHSWWPGLIWLFGSALLIGRMLVTRLFFYVHARRRRALNQPALLARVAELSRRLRLRQTVGVLQIKGLRGPIAFGILRPTIGLPVDFSTFSPREQDAMLIHELAHLAARDPMWYSLADVLAAFMWWHPLVWWMRRRLHAATEAAADEACVLVEDGPNILAQALVQMGRRFLERQRLGLLGVHGNGFRSDLGRRVERLMGLNPRTWRPVSRIPLWAARAGGPLALVAIAVCSCDWMLPAKQRAPDNGWRDSLAARTFAAVFHAQETTPAGSPSDVQRETNLPSKPPATTHLYTRAFKVEPITFVRRLQDAVARQSPSVKPGEPQFPPSELPIRRVDPDAPVTDRLLPKIHHAQITDHLRDHLDAMRHFFLAAGVDLAPPKSLFWNDRLGMLMVRATLDDLDAIEKSVQILNTPTPQVTIEVKIAEMSEAASKQLGLDWLGGAASATLSTNQLRNPFVDPNTAAPNYATVLTAPQYRLVVRAMEQRTGLDLLALPRVTTLSARQAQIKIVTLKSVITSLAEIANQPGVFDLVITQQECGPIVDVVPLVRPDGYTIELTVIAALREFLGYQPTPEVVKVLGSDANIESSPKPLPQFRVCQAMANPVLWDGQTVALGMGVWNDRVRIAFLTVTIIDPAGNRVHGEEEGEFRTRGIPPQTR